MAITKLSIEEFLALSQHHPVLDVRSPGEYVHAHIPSAHSLPLFTDEERKIVGTAYKQESKQIAVKIGLKYFGKKMVQLVESVEKHFETPKGTIQPIEEKWVLVHCWRGGMRSAGVAWLLDLYGFKVFTLIGGYKAYRNWVIAQFQRDFELVILGGYTGSGKTETLAEIKKTHQVIDLEKMAGHKGSAFGNLEMIPQPSQEMFENLLAEQLAKTDPKQPLWLEDESQRIGEINIPAVFFAQMRKSKIKFLEIPFEERLLHIVDGYGKHQRERLVNAVIRIKKKLGGLETKNTLNFLIEDNMVEAFRILLLYYDKFYGKSLLNRNNFEQVFEPVKADHVDPVANAKQLIQ